ncbi:hypothetical protein EUGRSUZ_L00659 [Eucalyptus grandis]|uniref:Uncharacterized protein n=1 Tax=Eucalyptus grandis TaxID=71139 RepID=A0A058ZUY1_EUCGR|nr:hypothetical protein EUGRSUZ_L00659 [Eucalyptus grandis]
MAEDVSKGHAFGNGVPHKPGFPLNESLENVLNCLSCGIRPMSWFFERFKYPRDAKSPNFRGINPLNLFEERSSHPRLVKSPRVAGMEPVRWL